MINDLYLYFQNFSTHNTKNGMKYFCDSFDINNIVDCIDLDRLDRFFLTINDVFINALKNGLMEIEPATIKFESKYTTSFFTIGLSCLKNAVILDTISIILEYLLLLIVKDETISYHDIFELKLLTKIIPLLQPDKVSIEKYVFLLTQFGSHEISREVMRFNEYISSFS